MTELEIQAKINLALSTGMWMVRRSNKGKSYGGFLWAPIGEWTEAPDWNPRPECGGGLHGNGPESSGYWGEGNRFDFCIIEDAIAIDDQKIKCRRAMILCHTFPEKLKIFKGDVYLRGCTLSEGFKMPDSIGGDVNLRGRTIPEGFKMPDSVGWYVDLRGCTIPEGFKMPDSVGGYVNLGGCTIPEGFKMPDSVGGYV